MDDPNGRLTICRLRVGKDNNLYVCGFFTETYTIGKKTYSYKTQYGLYYKGLFFVMSSKGNIINSRLANEDLNQADKIFDIEAKDTNSIYLFGYVRDSILYQKKWFSSMKKKSAGAGNYYPFFALVSLSKGANWIKLTDYKDSNGVNDFTGGYNYGRCKFDRSNNFYAAFAQRNKIVSLGGLTDSTKAYWCFTKLDSLGNALWLRVTGQITDFEPDLKNNLVYTGSYTDSLTLTPLKLKATSQPYTAYITKTYDYEIYRGKVSSGPYCAGDTIKIPYTKLGVFNKNNYFVAELSDEFGNFEGRERELGRLKTTSDSFIKGQLPLFKVASSGRYRIRIRSTSPVVQSYYKLGILKLLIYSRDKADPGPPETICYGDSLKLNTYGGTKWTWSPKYKMSDSTLRQPIVWPTQNTTYKIIIGDSSGCGAPDTASKLINVRHPLKTVLAFTDTAVCGTGDLKVSYYFTGGDSVNYKFQWYYVSSPKLWFATKKGQNVLTDTLVYYPSDPFEKLAIVLKDGCTNKPDTAYLTISQRKPVVITTKFSDTTVCNGQTLNYKANATSGLAKSFRYQWKDLNSNSVLSSSDSLKLSASKTLKIQLIVNDGCEALGDTALFEVKVKAELKAQSNLRDTAICYGKTLNYTATAQGGDAKAYKFSWVLNNKLIDTTNQLLLTTNHYSNTSNLLLILKDNCSFPNDTIKKTITVKPSPKADFIWDLACSKTITKFQFTGSKPQSPIQTSFRWNFNNEATSSIENPSHKFASVGTSTSTLILSSDNGCSDTMKKGIVIKPQSKADFTANDVCETDSAFFINKSQDATSYNWRFGDGQKSTLESPKHLYTIGGTTTTFNVSLVAVVANGCSDSIGKAISINSNPNSGFTHTLTGTKVDLKATVQGNTKYQWKFGSTDSATTTSGNYTFTLTKPEQYKICLKVTNLAGCISQTCKDITVGISDILKPSGFKIYPNPNAGIFTIEIENPSNNSSIEVYNLVGELAKKVERVGKVTTLNLDATAGIYFVRVKNGDAVWGQKVTITN